MSDDAWEKVGRRIAAAVFTGIAVMIGVDLTLDRMEGLPLTHIAVEGAMLVLALAGAVVVLRRFGRVSSDLVAARRDAARWRGEHQALVQGLGRAIQGQFDLWGLTPAESEIGLLLLKGLTHQEIAAVRGTSERTVREQARALYHKAGLAGRNELAAFFLEDLLPGQSEGGGAPGGGE